jgi:hypothetical protein
VTSGAHTVRGTVRVSAYRVYRSAYRTRHTRVKTPLFPTLTPFRRTSVLYVASSQDVVCSLCSRSCLSGSLTLRISFVYALELAGWKSIRGPAPPNTRYKQLFPELVRTTSNKRHRAYGDARSIQERLSVKLQHSTGFKIGPRRHCSRRALTYDLAVR